MFRRLLWLGCAVLCAQQDPVFRPKQMRDYNPRAADGRCIVRVRVDDESDVELRGDRILLRTLTGRAGRDDGSECSQPLPSGGFTKFAFRGIDGRGEVRLVQEPRLGNQWTAIVAIRDKKGGDEGYTFELTWTADPTAAPTGATGGSIFDRPSTSGSGSGGGILPNLSGLGSGQSPIQAKFTGFDETLSSTGALRVNNQDQNIRRLRANLRSDGNAEFTLYGNEVLQMAGRWTGGGNALDITVTNVGGEAASGRGRLYLNSGGRFDRIELDGDSQRFGGRFQLNVRR
ncbi:MAG: hypothetical protein JNK48_11370 [Bryobacterales bacterium]|nr:hypothetical protein [Bryobacterales bacterium]